MLARVVQPVLWSQSLNAKKKKEENEEKKFKDLTQLKMMLKFNPDGDLKILK